MRFQPKEANRKLLQKGKCTERHKKETKGKGVGRREVERLWGKDRNKTEIIVLGKANIFLLSDAENNDKALVKINHGNNKGKISYYIKANFYSQSL